MVPKSDGSGLHVILPHVQALNQFPLPPHPKEFFVLKKHNNALTEAGSAEQDQIVNLLPVRDTIRYMNLFVQSLTPNHITSFADHPFFPLLIIFDLALRGYALYKAAKNNQPVWFVALLLVNSVGILPIIYLLFFAPKQEGASSPKPKATPAKKPSRSTKKK